MASADYSNDDFCNDQSELEFPVEFGRLYLIRVGGGSSSAQGNGELLVTCFNDCNENGIDDLTDIAMFPTQHAMTELVNFVEEYGRNNCLVP